MQIDVLPSFWAGLSRKRTEVEVASFDRELATTDTDVRLPRLDITCRNMHALEVVWVHALAFGMLLDVELLGAACGVTLRLGTPTPILHRKDK
jgi:hypothetical protein